MKLPRHPLTTEPCCKILSAQIVWMPPSEDGDGPYYRVGNKFRPSDRVITAITVTADLPGLHCNMTRVCVWSGDQLLMEMPLHNVECVQYVTTDLGGAT